MGGAVNGGAENGGVNGGMPGAPAKSSRAARRQAFLNVRGGGLRKGLRSAPTAVKRPILARTRAGAAAEARVAALVRRKAVEVETVVKMERLYRIRRRRPVRGGFGIASLR